MRFVTGSKNSLTFVHVLCYKIAQKRQDQRYENMRRLHPRGAANRGIAVDAAGAMLGPDCALVRRMATGYRSLAGDEAAALQGFLFGYAREPDWLFDHCRRIAEAPNNGEVAFAQILGIYTLSDDLDDGQLARLARVGPLIKANFNPDGGEWTTEGEVDGEPSALVPSAGSERSPPATEAQSGARNPALIPAQLTIPWDLPADIPGEIPGMPTEITPIPFDFPGAERKQPPLPTNPFPRDPECAEEWAAAYDYCDRMEKEGKFRPGYSAPGKDYRSCLLGQVSERCGGNPTS